MGKKRYYQLILTKCALKKCVNGIKIYFIQKTEIQYMLKKQGL